MESLVSIIWTGEPVESVIRLLIVLMCLEFVAILIAYLRGVR